ncbi:MAG: hypothetical protein AB7D42_04085 [Candidatus Methanomethylophilaceae archaeon]|nr:hypothetical protein [Candidatus Methanomethylophilaceae archaeon]
MIFRKDIPKEISAVKLSKWYDALEDREKVRLSRYVEGANTSSKVAFLKDMMSRANAEGNHSAAITLGEFAETQKLTASERFQLTEEYILALFEKEDYPKAKEMCLANLELVPEILPNILGKDGQIPENICCRNRLIDIMVGVEKDYDGAVEMLGRFNNMGILSDEDLAFRKQSLNVRRLQITFDSIYSYKFTE